ncbi:methylated-DNA--protein-cysteine methyltransferase [Pyrococcus abyssi]|uniref:Methylated-DNA--protein-cysteine methyltransferase n=1 Tax=Pyrococcus abyssi (strain GE5 / Orsay) TaxID=272844 RepID=OGT_PYRAB|nr:methylated-DNA--protein-cysteine methyltransferase [Pyrococcus abyssi]Q9V1N7.1 RecName: Full=Methylated-DNA--protein-cysteine methyltransferase; AltName: Full=6-O-methylguanine-DNA methyltransferase; Short=MGMT; AltName: Full=O-6-methylguanine-DNA-alkyltransferase [Pyrococcus abyssi GE5]CAB49312.1 ogt 6-O-methylguanine-DNA methyltransferase (EC 2.1.1.63) [Pyrococcus abyssi GE5]CCE69768.1 TPA: methylated-DNA--protein-cysteine methyltransferase [Pyrococcus abyssi GE5]
MLSCESFKIKGREIIICVIWEEGIQGIVYSLDGREFLEKQLSRLISMLNKRGVSLSLKERHSKYPELVFNVLTGKISNEEGFEELSLEGLTDFEIRVYSWLVKNVKRGEVITYGKVAKELKTSALAIGGAMKRNPYPIVVPCHRVVGKKDPWLYTPKPEYKKFLLEVEGWTS